MPDPHSCLKNGTKLAQWMMERLLNPNSICNYDKGTCGTLFNK